MQHMDTHELVAPPMVSTATVPRCGRMTDTISLVGQRANSIDSEIYEIDTGVPAAVPRLLAGGAGYRWRIFDRSADDHRLLLGRAPAQAPRFHRR